jgi:hypothetical protein
MQILNSEGMEAEGQVSDGKKGKKKNKKDKKEKKDGPKEDCIVF